MGTTGFVAAILSVLGFFLEFSAGGFDKERFLTELAVLSGHYENLYKTSITERNEFAANMTARSSSKKKDSKSKNPFLKRLSVFPQEKREAQNEKKLFAAFYMIFLLAAFVSVPLFVIKKTLDMKSGWHGITWEALKVK